jgi:hypothetical protein
MSVDQGLRVLVAAVHVSVCFVVFGKPAITPDVIESWIDGGPHAIAANASTSFEQLKISIGLAAFSGLYHAIAVLCDATYREELLPTTCRPPLREAFADRAATCRCGPRPRSAPRDHLRQRERHDPPAQLRARLVDVDAGAAAAR